MWTPYVTINNDIKQPLNRQQMALATITLTAKASASAAATTATAVATNSGFVQAIYEGNNLLVSGVPAGVSIAHFSGADSLQLRKGSAIPTGTILSNDNTYAVSVIVNLD